MTELAAGSGLYGPTLFDAYRAFAPRPAALFALPVVRRPGPGVVTALGGGYLASGAGDAARLPRPYLPAALKLDGQEGAGEVQTPLLGAAADDLALGDRVYMRHAKAGELCERFDRPAPAGGRGDRRRGADLSWRGTMLPVKRRRGRWRPCCARSSRALAPLDRTPCSPGEREAAEWLAGRLAAIDGVEVALEDEPSWGTFPPTATGVGLLGMASAGLVAAGAPGRRDAAAP